MGSPLALVAVIDLAELREGPTQRSAVVDKIRQACSTLGFFQVVNHGIDPTILSKALEAADSFFRLSEQEKAKFLSSDVSKPIRYASSVKDVTAEIPYWKAFLKHYANPLKDWVQYWPDNPPNYREDMGAYSSQVQKLAAELTGAIMESLGLGSNYLSRKLDEGVQILASNYYPPCHRPNLPLGSPPHSDHSCLTILLENSPGLEIMDMQDSGSWKLVPHIDGSLQVHIGDHFEVLSNGLYKSVVHKAILNGKGTRISIASLHSLGLDVNVEPAKELVDDHHPKAYKGSSLRDFLNFLSTTDPGKGIFSFVSTLKMNNR